MHLNKIKDKDLLVRYSEIIEELRNRKVLRSNNNPVADYAEFLVAKKFNLKLQPNSNKSFDALDEKTGLKYQIKSRRVTKSNSSRQLGVIRNIGKNSFDFIVAIFFNARFDVKEIYKIPKKIIKKYARFSKHQNGYILIMRGPILKDKNVKRIK